MSTFVADRPTHSDNAYGERRSAEETNHLTRLVRSITRLTPGLHESNFCGLFTSSPVMVRDFSV
jgi:hypothetical protein